MSWNILLNERILFLKQGIPDKTEDSFDKRIRERIRQEEQNYKNRAESKGDDDKVREALETKETQEEENEADQVDLISAAMNEYQLGNFSPILMSPDDLPFDAFVVSQEEDFKNLELKRRQVMGVANPDVEDEFEMKAREKIGIGAEEEEAEVTSKAGATAASASAASAGNEPNKSNTQEVAIDHHYSWSDKYRPRKPRYYNRVHTGYDWNQYNKKHYDVDNPPPKTVQGYKLNVKH